MGSRRRAWSPYKEKVVAFVRANPGCCKMDVLRHVTYSPRRVPNKQSYIVETAIRHGWIVAFKAGGRYRLYTHDMVPGYLRAGDPEQRQPSPPARPAPCRWGPADGPGLPEPEAAEVV
jgi:hypothetical protein